MRLKHDTFSCNERVQTVCNIWELVLQVFFLSLVSNWPLFEEINRDV